MEQTASLTKYFRESFLSDDDHAVRHPVRELIKALHANFGTNISGLPGDLDPMLDTIDLNSRVISEIRAALSAGFCESDAQTKISAEILDEVFTYFSLAMYLCTIGLIVPARMSVRRAFELGLAAVYMWDLPHEYWGWRRKDDDLSFSAMVAHLNSPGYLEYLAQLHGVTSVTPLCDQGKFQDLYRQLSNTVHGKPTGVPALSPRRYMVEDNGLGRQLLLIIDAQNCVIRLLFGRFKGLEAVIISVLPQIKRA